MIYREDFCQWISKKIGSTIGLGTNPDKQKLLWRRRRKRKSGGTGNRGLLLCRHRGRRTERTLVCFTLLTGWSGLGNVAFSIYSANKNIVSIVFEDHRALFVENITNCPILLVIKFRTTYKHFFLCFQNYSVGGKGRWGGIT